MVDVDVRFNVGEDQPINADFEVQPDATFTADIEIETPIKDHDKLNNRDLPDQHPISAITGLETALNNESQAIAALDNKIEEEISRAEGAESVLVAKIEEEKTRATTAEDVLQNNIDAEETRAEAAEQANATAISDEENRARQAESDLNTAIQTETNRAESAESALSDAISAETTRAEEAESTLQTNINNESSRAQQAETNLSTAISAEQTRAETAESGLSADISAEATARQNADMALQTNINTEITNRTNADTALGTRIDNETSARESADDTLQDNIDSEESTRASEISRVEGLISAETTRATNAEQVNATSISNHIADKNNPHEVSKAQVGLGNVDNTSDANKPISTATRTALNAIGDEIDTINSKIPAQASSTNQLADRDFVNSSVATNTADFIDTFASVSELESYTGTVTNNDYAFVVNRVVTDNGNDWSTFTSLDGYDKSLLTNFDYAWVINGVNFDLYRFDILQQAWDLRAENIEKDDVSLNITYNRYKATVVSNVVSWKWEYSLNNSSFTAEQWAAINSGATQDNIAQINVNAGNITTLSQTKQDNITSSNMLDADLVDDSTSTNKFVTSADITNWNAKQNAISDLETIRSGAAKGASSVQSVTQGTANGTINVDGSDVPVKGLGSAAYTNSTSYDEAGSASQAETNAKNYADSLSTNYATAAQGTKADTAIQPSDLATVATSGSYTDLNNQPTIGNATLTIQKNGTTVDTFTANSIVDKTVNIEVPTNNNQLTNGAGYQTASDVATAISGKQDTLVSGTNIKTINNNSILGSGNLTLDGLPSQTGQSGKFLTTDGNSASWDIPTVQASFANITGQPSDNTNLATALNAKADDSDVVKLTGNQTIAGVKTLTSSPLILKDTQNALSENASTNTFTDVLINDKNNIPIGIWEYRHLTGNGSGMSMALRKRGSESSAVWSRIGIFQDTSGNFFTEAPTPATSDNSTKIATTAFVNNKFQVVTALPASPTAGVFYFVKE